MKVTSRGAARAAINKLPGRRGGARCWGAPAGPRLSITSAEIQALKAEVVAILDELEIGYARIGGDRKVTIEIDAQAVYVVPLYVRALEESEVVVAESGVTAAVLEGRQKRWRALLALWTALAAAHAQLIGSRLIVAAAQGRMWDKLLEDLQRDLADESRSEEERAELRVAAAQVLMQAEREAVDRRKRADDLKAAREAAAQQVAAATARRRQLEALLSLQDDQEIDPEMLEELARIYIHRVQVSADRGPGLAGDQRAQR